MGPAIAEAERIRPQRQPESLLRENLGRVTYTETTRWDGGRERIYSLEQRGRLHTFSMAVPFEGDFPTVLPKEKGFTVQVQVDQGELSFSTEEAQVRIELPDDHRMDSAPPGEFHRAGFVEIKQGQARVFSGEMANLYEELVEIDTAASIIARAETEKVHIDLKKPVGTLAAEGAVIVETWHIEAKDILQSGIDEFTTSGGCRLNGITLPKGTYSSEKLKTINPTKEQTGRRRETTSSDAREYRRRKRSLRKSREARLQELDLSEEFQQIFSPRDIVEEQQRRGFLRRRKVEPTQPRQAIDSPVVQSVPEFADVLAKTQDNFGAPNIDHKLFKVAMVLTELLPATRGMKSVLSQEALRHLRNRENHPLINELVNALQYDNSRYIHEIVRDKRIQGERLLVELHRILTHYSRQIEPALKKEMPGKDREVLYYTREGILALSYPEGVRAPTVYEPIEEGYLKGENTVRIDSHGFPLARFDMQGVAIVDATAVPYVKELSVRGGDFLFGGNATAAVTEGRIINPDGDVIDKRGVYVIENGHGIPLEATLAGTERS